MVRSKATLTSKNQLTLPVAVRDALGVAVGDQIVFEIADNRVVVVPNVAEGRFKKYVARYRVGRGSTRKETDAWLRKLRGHND